MRAREDLTNVQFPMLNSHPKGEAAAVEHLAIRHPLRMRIEHWELSIGQIPGRIQGRGFCQVIFARALSEQHWAKPATTSIAFLSRRNKLPDTPETHRLCTSNISLLCRIGGSDGEALAGLARWFSGGVVRIRQFPRGWRSAAAVHECLIGLAD